MRYIFPVAELQLKSKQADGLGGGRVVVHKPPVYCSENSTTSQGAPAQLLKDICSLLERGFVCSLIIVGQPVSSNNAVDSVRHVLCGIAGQLQSKQQPRTPDSRTDQTTPIELAVACWTEAQNSQTNILLPGSYSHSTAAVKVAGAAEIRKVFRLAGQSSKQRFYRDSKPTKHASNSGCQDSNRVGNSSTNKVEHAAATAVPWLVGSSVGSQLIVPQQQLLAVVADLWYLQRRSRASAQVTACNQQDITSCLHVVDLTQSFAIGSSRTHTVNGSPVKGAASKRAFEGKRQLCSSNSAQEKQQHSKAAKSFWVSFTTLINHLAHSINSSKAGAPVYATARSHPLLRRIAAYIAGPVCCHYLVSQPNDTQRAGAAKLAAKETQTATAAKGTHKGYIYSKEELQQQCAEQHLRRVLQQAQTLQTCCEAADCPQGPWAVHQSSEAFASSAESSGGCGSLPSITYQLMSFQEFVQLHKGKGTGISSQLQRSISPSNPVAAGCASLLPLDQLKLDRISTTRRRYQSPSTRSRYQSPSAATTPRSSITAGTSAATGHAFCAPDCTSSCCQLQRLLSRSNSSLRAGHSTTTIVCSDATTPCALIGSRSLAQSRSHSMHQLQHSNSPAACAAVSPLEQTCQEASSVTGVASVAAAAAPLSAVTSQRCKASLQPLSVTDALPSAHASTSGPTPITPTGRRYGGGGVDAFAASAAVAGNALSASRSAGNVLPAAGTIAANGALARQVKQAGVGLISPRSLLSQEPNAFSEHSEATAAEAGQLIANNPSYNAATAASAAASDNQQSGHAVALLSLQKQQSQLQQMLHAQHSMKLQHQASSGVTSSLHAIQARQLQYQAPGIADSLQTSQSRQQVGIVAGDDRQQQQYESIQLPAVETNAAVVQLEQRFNSIRHNFEAVLRKPKRQSAASVAGLLSPPAGGGGGEAADAWGGVSQQPSGKQSVLECNSSTVSQHVQQIHSSPSKQIHQQSSVDKGQRHADGAALNTAHITTTADSSWAAGSAANTAQNSSHLGTGHRPWSHQTTSRTTGSPQDNLEVTFSGALTGQDAHVSITTAHAQHSTGAEAIVDAGLPEEQSSRLFIEPSTSSAADSVLHTAVQGRKSIASAANSVLGTVGHCRSSSTQAPSVGQQQSQLTARHHETAAASTNQQQHHTTHKAVCSSDTAPMHKGQRPSNCTKLKQSSSVSSHSSSGNSGMRRLRLGPKHSRRHSFSHSLLPFRLSSAEDIELVGEGGYSVPVTGAGRDSSHMLVVLRQHAKQLQQQNDSLVRVLERERQQHQKAKQQAADVQFELKERHAEWEVMLHTLRHDRAALAAQLRKALAAGDHQEVVDSYDAALAASAARVAEAQAAAAALAGQLTEAELQLQQLQHICSRAALGGCAYSNNSSTIGSPEQMRADGAAVTVALAAAGARHKSLQKWHHSRPATASGPYCSSPGNDSSRSVKALRQHQKHTEQQLAKQQQEVSQLQRENIKLLRYRKQYDAVIGKMQEMAVSQDAVAAAAHDAGLRAAEAAGRATRLESQLNEAQQANQQLLTAKNELEAQLQAFQWQLQELRHDVNVSAVLGRSSLVMGTLAGTDSYLIAGRPAASAAAAAVAAAPPWVRHSVLGPQASEQLEGTVLDRPESRRYSGANANGAAIAVAELQTSAVAEQRQCRQQSSSCRSSGRSAVDVSGLNAHGCQVTDAGIGHEVTTVVTDQAAWLTPSGSTAQSRYSRSLNSQRVSQQLHNAATAAAQAPAAAPAVSPAPVAGKDSPTVDWQVLQPITAAPSTPGRPSTAIALMQAPGSPVVQAARAADGVVADTNHTVSSVGNNTSQQFSTHKSRSATMQPVQANNIHSTVDSPNTAALALAQDVAGLLPAGSPLHRQLASLMAAIAAGVEERKALAAQGQMLLQMVVGPCRT